MQQSLRRLSSLAIVAVTALLASAAAADARIVEIGRAGGAAPPSCPGNPCLAVARTTGYMAQSGTTKGSYRVPASGRIVAWTVDLSTPSPSQVAYFNGRFGNASAAITILRRGKKKLQRFNVGQAPMKSLAPYFGEEVQFPLRESLRVHRGDIVALSVPTWAPVLSQLLGDGTAWLASRPRGGCDDTDTQTVHDEAGPTRYRCKYAARLAYSATLVTQPEPAPAS
jgi:hypothetical protein